MVQSINVFDHFALVTSPALNMPSHNGLDERGLGTAHQLFGIAYVFIVLLDYS